MGRAVERGRIYYDYALTEDGAVVHYGSTREDYLTDVLAQKRRNSSTRAPPGRSGYADGFEEYYNLAKDPRELHNLRRRSISARSGRGCAECATRFRPG